MIQVLYIYFYYYYTSSTSDHKALDPGGWGPLPKVILGVLRTGSQRGRKIWESEGLAPWPSLSSLHWLCDLREKLLILSGLDGGGHHLLHMAGNCSSERGQIHARRPA